MVPEVGVIGGLTTLSEDKVVLPDDERASLGNGRRDEISMLVHLLLLQMDHTLSLFLVVLKLPMLPMFLKFEIKGALTRGRGRDLL